MSKFSWRLLLRNGSIVAAVLGAVTLIACEHKKPVQKNSAKPATAPSSITGVPVTGALGATYFYHVADFLICGDYGWDSYATTINWGDGSSQGTISNPAYDHHLVGYHNYSNPGIYPISIHLSATCDNAGNTWSDSADGTSRAVIYSAPQSVASLVLSLTTVTVGTTTTGTITLAGNAPVGGTQVKLVSSAPAAVQMPLTAIVPAGQMKKTFSVKALVSGAVAIDASSGEGTQSAQANLTIN